MRAFQVMKKMLESKKLFNSEKEGCSKKNFGALSSEVKEILPQAEPSSQ
jgi:hypothetical protein